MPEQISSIRELDIVALLEAEYKPRCGIVVPWLAEGEMCLLFAQRGVGKTFFCMWLAASVSLGYSFCGWPVVKKRVLYVDGEMGFPNSQSRFRTIFKALGHSPTKDHLRLVSYPENGAFPNLSLHENQQMIEETAEAFDVIIIDNLFTVAGRISPRDDEFRIWERMQSWFIRLREKGKTVVLIHHSGKSGEQSGTMMKENICDVVVKLSVQKTEEHQGCSFQFEITKERNFVKGDCPPRVCKLYPKTCEWVWSYLKDSKANFINRKLAEGWSMTDLSVYLSTSRAEVKELSKLGLNQETEEKKDERKEEQQSLFDEF